MKKQSQQPNMDEWLLDAMHGLETNEDEEQHQAVTQADFLTPEAFAYFSTIEQNNSTHGIERTIRRLITRSIWPRILVARINSMLSTAMTLFIEGHWEFLKLSLSFIKSAQHYLGLTLHGLRLTMNVAHLLQITTSSDSAGEKLHQYLASSWFELCTDLQGLISALIPLNYFVLSCGLMVLELILIAIRAWNEQQHLLHHIKIIDNAINNQELQPEQHDELVRAKAHAEAMLLHTNKKFTLNLGVTVLTTTLFFFKNIVLPLAMVSIATNPFIPFIFAVIALSVSMISHYLNKYIDQQKPKIQEQSRRHLFFREKPVCMDSQLIFNTSLNSTEKYNAMYNQPQSVSFPAILDIDCSLVREKIF